MSDLPATNPSIQRSQTAPTRSGRSVGGKRVDNIREKLTNAVANGSLYEALQMIKTVHARCDLSLLLHSIVSTIAHIN